MNSGCHGVGRTPPDRYDTRLLAERIIRLVLVQEDLDEKFYLQGKFDDYKALPPVWDWRDESWLKSKELKSRS